MQVQVGTVINGKITGITGFGAFVELEGGGNGLVHISEVASEYVDDINNHLSVGQEVKVKVVNVEGNGKISLSIKKAAEVKKPDGGGPSGGRPGGGKSGGRPGGGRPSAGGNASAAFRPAAPQNPAEMSFEDKLLKFKQDSDEKMLSLKRSSDGKRGSGGYRRTY